MKYFLTFFLFLVCTFTLHAGNYTVERGQSMILKCTANAPAGGWITHVFFDLVNKEDSQYLGIAYTSSDCFATIYGLKTSTRIAVEVTYHYSYRGTYDNDIHVGHGSYIDYITVSGLRSATSFKFREGSDIIVPPGGSTVVHVDFYPLGSEPSNFSFALLSTLGQPYNFEVNHVNASSYDILVSAKERPASYVYLLAYIDNDQKTVQTAKLTIGDKETNIMPTSISITPTSLILVEGESERLTISFIPDNTWSKPEYKTSNSTVATVDETGKVTAISAGKANIIVTAAGKEEICEVQVLAKASDFSIDQTLALTAGFSYIIVPRPIPIGSKATFRLSTSDSDIITVSGRQITGIRTGTATLKVECTESGTSKLITINVTAPEQGADTREAIQRVQTVKKLFYKSIINK